MALADLDEVQAGLAVIPELVLHTKTRECLLFARCTRCGKCWGGSGALEALVQDSILEVQQAFLSI